MFDVFLSRHSFLSSGVKSLDFFVYFAGTSAVFGELFVAFVGFISSLGVVRERPLAILGNTRWTLRGFIAY